MTDIFYLHIAGTKNWDCKWLFESLDKLDRFLRTLPLVELEIERQVPISEDSEEFRTEIKQLSGEDAVRFWDTHMTLIRIDTEKFVKTHALYKAKYWDEESLFRRLRKLNER